MGRSRAKFNPRLSMAFSVESEATITSERYMRGLSNEREHDSGTDSAAAKPGRPSALAGLVGLFTGCGVLVLALFLPLPARFGEVDGVTPGEVVSYSFYVVGAVSLAVVVLVILAAAHGSDVAQLSDLEQDNKVVPYLHLMKDSILLGLTDSRIAFGYFGGFVVRASTVAISLFISLFVNTYFISNGFAGARPTTHRSS